jgi:hypothetical protein
MKNVSPLLPADETEIIPATAALLTASISELNVDTERGTQRHIDHVKMIAEVAVLVRIGSPIDRLRYHVGTAAAAEHAYRVKVGLRCHARAYFQVGRIRRGGVVEACVRGAIGVHAAATDRACGMRTMAAAIHRVWIGLRGIACVVSIANEVGTADHSRSRENDVVRIKPDHRSRIDVLIGSQGAVAAKIRMDVVQAGVDIADLDTLAGGIERQAE